MVFGEGDEAAQGPGVFLRESLEAGFHVGVGQERLLRRRVVHLKITLLQHIVDHALQPICRPSSGE